MTGRTAVGEHIVASYDALNACINDNKFLAVLHDASDLLVRCLQAGNKILLCGNGGSAADAQHFAAELVGSYLDRKRAPLAAVALTTNTSTVTAIGNDFGFDEIFRRQVQALGRSGDVLAALSTSGNSGNIIRAVDYALTHDMNVIAFTGRKPCALGELCDIYGMPVLRVPADSTPLIQQIHQVAYHALCADIEMRMFSPKVA